MREAGEGKEDERREEVRNGKRLKTWRQEIGNGNGLLEKEREREMGKGCDEPAA